MPRHERIFNFNCPPNDGPLALSTNLSLPDEGKFEIEGWISNFGASNVHIFGGSLAVAECQQRLAEPAAGGPIDMLMTLPAGAIGRCFLREDLTTITVFYEAVNSVQQAQVVTVRVRDR